MRNLWRFSACVLLLIGCNKPQPPVPKQTKLSDFTYNVQEVTLSYWVGQGYNGFAPVFRVDVRYPGQVTFRCESACVAPGEHHHTIPKERFEDLVRRFHNSGLFRIPARGVDVVPLDAPPVHLVFRDSKSTYEAADLRAVSDQREDATALADLEGRMLSSTEADQYFHSSVALYRRLLASGWDVNTMGKDHHNALTWVLFAKDAESARFLLQHGSKAIDSALFFAMRDVALFRLALGSAQLPLSDESTANLLRAAAAYPTSERLRLLLDAGLDPRHFGVDALGGAAWGGSRENVRLLLSKGVDPNQRDSSGRTAIWIALDSKNPDSTTLLTEIGVDVNAVDKAGDTALMYDALVNHGSHIPALLAAGADPTIRDRKGKTALDLLPVSSHDAKCEIARKMIAEAIQSKAQAKH